MERNFAVAGHFASQLALIAFAVCEARGLMVGGDFSATTKTALFAALVMSAFGYVTGELARRVVEESAQAEFQALFPANDSAEQPGQASAK